MEPHGWFWLRLLSCLFFALMIQGNLKSAGSPGTGFFALFWCWLWLWLKKFSWSCIHSNLMASSKSHPPHDPNNDWQILCLLVRPRPGKDRNAKQKLSDQTLLWHMAMHWCVSNVCPNRHASPFWQQTTDLVHLLKTSLWQSASGQSQLYADSRLPSGIFSRLPRQILQRRYLNMSHGHKYEQFIENGSSFACKNKKLTSSQKTLICFCNLWVTRNSDAADLSCQAPWLAFWPIVSIPHSPSGVEIIAPNTRIGWAQFLCLFNCPCLVTWHIHRCSASSWTFSSFAFPFGLADLFMQLCSCLSYDLPIRKSVINILLLVVIKAL